jgi:uncharacterized membrane protein
MQNIPWNKQLIRFRNQFFTGLIVLMPLTLTVIIIIFLFNKLDGILGPFLVRHMENHYIKGLGLIILLVVIWFVGLLATNILGKQFVKFYESIIDRVPMLNTIFKWIKDISHNLFSEESTSFKQVVLAWNPVYGFYIMGFLTSSEVLKLKVKGKKHEILHVFIPTPPNPASGFLLLVPKANVIPLDVSIEDGLKAIVSLGVIHPKSYEHRKLL